MVANKPSYRGNCSTGGARSTLPIPESHMLVLEPQVLDSMDVLIEGTDSSRYSQ